MPAKRAAVPKPLSLEQVLWNCRNALRGKCNKANNRDAVLALVFLKFAGDKFEKRRSEIIVQYGDIPAFVEKPAFYLAENVFYLDETSRWAGYDVPLVSNANYAWALHMLSKFMSPVLIKGSLEDGI
jgi:type I restriction-modification system DNA methylase subunit